MIKVMSDGTVSAWRDRDGTPILLDLADGGGLKAFVQPMGRDKLHYKDCVVQPSSAVYGLDGVRATVYGNTHGRYEFPLNLPPRGYDFPWHCQLWVTITVYNRTLRYQAVLTRDEKCDGPEGVDVSFGILPQFGVPDGEWCVRRNEIPIANQQSESPEVGAIFNPKRNQGTEQEAIDQVCLDTTRGRISFESLSGFDGFRLESYPSTKSVCLAPVMGLYTIQTFNRGVALMAATSISYTPR